MALELAATDLDALLGRALTLADAARRLLLEELVPDTLRDRLRRRP